MAVASSTYHLPTKTHVFLKWCRIPSYRVSSKFEVFVWPSLVDRHRERIALHEPSEKCNPPNIGLGRKINETPTSPDMQKNPESHNGDGHRNLDELSDHTTQSAPNEANTIKDEKSNGTKPAPPSGRRSRKKPAATSEDDEEPLVDTTAALQLHSKKTERMQKRLEKKSKNKKPASKPQSFLDLPSELILEILTYLQPRDLFRLQRLNKPMNAFIRENEPTISRDLIRTRYSNLAKCFPLPIPFTTLDPKYHSALLSPKRQDLLAIHKKPYQHIQPLDPLAICTCMTCVFAWNNLCTILDLAHWQGDLDARVPISMIPRGASAPWNSDLIETSARRVQAAMRSPLVYTALLALHLDTTTRTILRRSKYIKPPQGGRVLAEHRPYQLSLAEAARGSDDFLARKGAPSYEFPFSRDNYYNLEAYVPNRKWSSEEGCWKYYAGTQHARDLEWVRDRFGVEEDGERVARRMAELEVRLKGADGGGGS